MTLYQKLEKASSEEDVKDIYIKALGLKQYQKNLIDIQTKEIWFEAKDNSKLSTYAMFTQLMVFFSRKGITSALFIMAAFLVSITHKNGGT